MTTLPNPTPSAEQDDSLELDRPCSEHAAAFLAKTSPNERFTLALTNVLPRLNEAGKPAEKILAAYLLHSMYHTVDIELNPFRGALAEAFAREQAAGAHHQLVWVLWKIVRGQGQDLAELSPNQLATSPLADECHPTQLRISNQPPRASTNAQSRPPMGTPLMSDEVGLTHSTSLVDPDDSFVAEHNEPRIHDAVGVIGSGKAPVERPSSVATTRPEDTPVAQPTNDVAGLMLPGLVSPPQNDDQERQVKTYASALELLASACCRVLNLAEQRTLKPLLPNFAYPVPVLSPSDLSSLIAYNPAVAASYLSCIISRSSALTIDPATDSSLWLAVTTRLPPTLASFDFFGRMLRDESPVVKSSAVETPLASGFMSLGSASAVASSHNGQVDLLPAGLLSPDLAPPPSTSRAAASAAPSGSNTATASGYGLGFGGQGSSKRTQTVSDVVRDTALGAFVSGCIAWVENAEQEEREGLVADDRVLRGIQGLCRFFSSLLKLQLIDPRSDADTAEMASFALAHSRFEDALGVYRLLASARSG